MRWKTTFWNTGLVFILSGLCGCSGSKTEEQVSNPPPEPEVIELKSEPTKIPPESIRPSQPADPLPRLIATINARGGKVSGDETGITAIDWHHAKINNLDLELLTDVPTLKRLYLAGTRIDSRGWIYLSALPHLERLALWRTPITDEDLNYLANAKNLEVLDLSQTRIRGTGLEYLKECRKLDTLILRSTYCDTNSFEQIAQIKSLRVVDVRGRNFRGPAIAPLKRLPALEELMIDFCDPEILKRLAEFPNIRRLDLSRPFVRELAKNFSEIAKMQKLESIKYCNFGNQDEFLQHVSKCPNLREIQILRGRGSAEFTDEGLATLTACRSLRLLDVREANVTLQGLRQIAQANPHVRILVYPIKLHGLEDAFRSMGLGAKHSRDGGPRLQLDREMNIISVRLEDAKVFPQALRLIAKAVDPEKLLSLGLGDTNLTDEDLANFRAGVNLKHLNLAGTRVTADGLKTWGGGSYPELPFLQTLDLSGTKLDNECLEWIGTLDSLKTLRLRDVKGLTEAGWANLRQLSNLEHFEE